MTDLQPGQVPQHVESPARSERRSKNGQNFYLYEARWQLSARESAEVSGVMQKFNEPLLGSMLLTLANYAEQNAAGTVLNVRAALLSFAEHASPQAPLSALTMADLLGFRHAHRSRTGHDGATANLRAFLRRCYDVGHGGVSKTLVDELKKWVLKNAPTGDAVNREDIESGPFTREELAGLEAEWMSRFEDGTISHETLTGVLLLSRTGRRPSQIASLKLKDLDDSRLEDVKPGDAKPPRRLLLVHFPRAKQKTAGWRELFRSVELIPGTWNMCVAQRQRVMERMAQLLSDLDWTLQEADRKAIFESAPLFPMWSLVPALQTELGASLSSGQHGAALRHLTAFVQGDEWHPDKQGITRILERACDGMEASNRIGEPLKAGARRFRYFLATEMDRMGVGQGVIAHALDHNDTSTVVAYRRNHPGRARVIDKATARALAPLARLFRGEVVDTEEDAVGGDDPAATRILFRGKGAATCGDRVQCGLSRLPIPCYTCNHFQPWLDGPHEEVLEDVLRERQERSVVLGPSSPLVERDDTTIFAIVQVIQRCEVRRAELNDGNRGPKTKAGTKA